MARYISTFCAGFEEYIESRLSELLGGAQVNAVYGGLCEYEYGGSARDIVAAGVFSNTFAVLKRWKGDVPFGAMVAQTKGKCAGAFPPGAGREEVATFRVRYSQANQFAAVDANITRNAEESISRATGLRVDRLGGDTEFWYIRRTEGVCYFARLLSGFAGDYQPQKGELRPELAKLICSWADIPAGGVIADLFAGYGSIARDIASRGEFGRLIVNDIDHLMVDTCRQRIGRGDRVTYLCEDCRSLVNIPTDSVDAVITDPPWGLYRGEEYTVDELYYSVFGELERIIRPGGMLVLLMSQKNEIGPLADEYKFTLLKRNNILVNGKKAVLYKYHKE